MGTRTQGVVGIAAPPMLAPGFRFHPTDGELVNYYLRRKMTLHVHDHHGFIPEVQLYNYEPWDLPDKSYSPNSDDTGAKVEWYLLVPRDRKFANGSRMNRATPAGFWKSTGKDRSVLHHDAVIGWKKTLVYHLGRAPNGVHTEWAMHEYRMHDDMTPMQDTFALCRLYKRNATTPSPGPPNVTNFDMEMGGASMQFWPNSAVADIEGASMPFGPNGLVADIEGASMQFGPNSVVADMEGASMQFWPNSVVPDMHFVPNAVAADAGQYIFDNLENFLHDEDSFAP